MTLTAIEKLIYEYFEVSKVLVIAPLHVASATWEDEINKFDHLRHMKIAKILGNEKSRISALMSDADIYTINKENVTWLIEYSKKIKKWKFDCLVIDESSAFKNHKAIRFQNLKKMCEIKNGKEYVIPRVIELTGTPSPNGYQDLWAQMYLLDWGEVLGKNITAFRNRYMFPVVGSTGQRFYKMRPEAHKEIHDRIKNLAISLKWQGNIKMPECIYSYIGINLSESEKKLFTN